MHDSKLLLLIKSIDKKEHNKLVEFLQWSYISKSEQISQLVKYIVKIAPNYDDKRLSKEACFQKLFPRESFDDMKLRRLMSKTLKLVDKFILYQQLEKDELIKHQLWTDYYKDNNIEYFFQTKLKAWNSTNKSTIDIGKRFLNNYLATLSKLDYINKQFAVQNVQKNIKKAVAKEMSETLKTLQDFYLYQALFLKCFILQQYETFNKDIQHPYEKFIANIKEEDVIHDPLIHLYYLVVAMLEDSSNKEKYLALKRNLSVFQEKKYNKYVLIHLSKFMEGFLIKKCGKEGIEIYYKELLDLYKYGIEHKLVFANDNNDFYPMKFRNIVIVGIRVKEFEWLESFIEEYHPTLPKNQQPFLHFYCLALLYFYQKKYKEADELLNKIENSDTFLMFDIKRLQLMVAYEEDNDFLLDSLMNAFRVLMSRDKFLSESMKNANQNFVNLLMRAVNSTSSNTKKIEKMEEELNSSKIFMERAWLKEKVQEKKVGRTIS